jgi:hypothetical protein
MLVVVIINQNVFTVTYVFLTVTNFPFRHELKNVLCTYVYYICNYTTYVTLNDTVVAIAHL